MSGDLATQVLMPLVMFQPNAGNKTIMVSSISFHLHPTVI
jgi:hypothetical protein